MRDYTHVIAVCFANKMDEYRGYTESERIVITYGLEIFLVLVNNCVGNSVWRFMQSLEPLYL